MFSIFKEALHEKERDSNGRKHVSVFKETLLLSTYLLMNDIKKKTNLSH